MFCPYYVYGLTACQYCCRYGNFIEMNEGYESNRLRMNNINKFDEDIKIYNRTRNNEDIDSNISSEYDYEDFYGTNEFRHIRRKKFTIEEVRNIGNTIGIDWNKYDINQFRAGLDVELEHGKVNPVTNVTNDDPIMTGKIALAHLNEFSDYYTRLAKIENQSGRNFNDI